MLPLSFYPQRTPFSQTGLLAYAAFTVHAISSVWNSCLPEISGHPFSPSLSLFHFSVAIYLSPTIVKHYVWESFFFLIVHNTQNREQSWAHNGHTINCRSKSRTIPSMSRICQVLFLICRWVYISFYISLASKCKTETFLR